MSDYGFEHNGRVFTPNQSEITPEENAARNQAIEAAELAHWQTKPDRMLAYYHFPAEAARTQALTGLATFRPYLLAAKETTIDQATVSTWRGARLGTIMSARVYRHNFGSRMVSIRVQGSNGAVYYGRASWDHGQCINLRRAR